MALSYVQQRRMKEALRRTGKALVLLLLLGGVAFGAWKGLKTSGVLGPSRSGRKEPRSASGAQVLAALEAGNYALARDGLLAVARTAPADEGVARIRDLMRKPLQVSFRFHSLPGGRLVRGAPDVENPAALSSRDPYYLEVHPAEECYLYLFQHLSSGKIARLFPDPAKVPTGNPFPGGPLRIPDGYDWLYLDKTPGTETIYLLSSRWRQTGLENAVEEIAKETDADREAKLVTALLARFGLEEQAAKEVPGLVFASYRFEHRADPGGAPPREEGR